MGRMVTKNPLQAVLDELAGANAMLGQAITMGDLAAIDGLARSIKMLERERDRHLEALAKPAPTYRAGLSARDRVVQLLRMTGSVTSNRLLGDLSSARFLEALDTAGLATLRRDELRAWSNAHTSTTGDGTSPSSASSRATAGRVYVVPALSHDRFTAVRGSLALSEWPLERRVVAPTSLRVELLRTAIALTERAHEEGKDSALDRVVQKLGSGLGIATYAIGAEALHAAILNTCREELAIIKPADERGRHDAARRAKTQLDEQAQLFGTQLAPVRTGRPRKKSREAS
jgi:hypothetical protein